MELICAKCSTPHEACGVIQAGQPICWACYTAELEAILAKLGPIEMPNEAISPFTSDEVHTIREWQTHSGRPYVCCGEAMDVQERALFCRACGNEMHYVKEVCAFGSPNAEICREPKNGEK